MIDTVLGLLTSPALSVIFRLKTSVVATVTVGAVNVGVAVFAPVSDTCVPEV